MASPIEITAARIPEVRKILPTEFPDARGSFAETYSRRAFAELGLTQEFVQDNQSFSRLRGTIRGLHFQIPPAAQAKLIRVLKGAVLDVAVDLRRGSPTYGTYVSEILSEHNRAQLFIPEAFAHGFRTLKDNTVVFYKVSRYYSPLHERGIRWDDPGLNIDWGASPKEVLLSTKDREHPSFAELPLFFEY